MQKGFFQMERYNATVIQLDFLGILVYNASMPNKRDAFLWWAIQCIKVTPYTKSYTNILITEFLIILDNSTYERVYTNNLHQFTPLVHQT